MEEMFNMSDEDIYGAFELEEEDENDLDYSGIVGDICFYHLYYFPSKEADRD